MNGKRSMKNMSELPVSGLRFEQDPSHMTKIFSGLYTARLI